MKVERIAGSKSWGLIPHPVHDGHFHTGWEHDRGASSDMEVGTNAIITGHFHVGGCSRGRSAANALGHFKGHQTVTYMLSVDGIATLFRLLQDGTFPIVDGYIDGVWTFVKQGQNIFLKPHVV